MRHAGRNGGFTLMEVMISVAIIGILASIAIPAFKTYQNRSKRSEAFANLGSIANLEKTFFSEYSVYVGVAPQPAAGVPSSDKRLWTAAADTAYERVGFRPEGAVFYDYEVNVDAAACPDLDCFTATSYGDVDANLSVALIMYVHPSTAGGMSTSGAFPPLGFPVDPVTGQTRTDAVAVNYQGDLY